MRWVAGVVLGLSLISRIACADGVFVGSFPPSTQGNEVSTRVTSAVPNACSPPVENLRNISDDAFRRGGYIINPESPLRYIVRLEAREILVTSTTYNNCTVAITAILASRSEQGPVIVYLYTDILITNDEPLKPAIESIRKSVSEVLVELLRRRSSPQ